MYTNIIAWPTYIYILYNIIIIITLNYYYYNHQRNTNFPSVLRLLPPPPSLKEEGRSRFFSFRRAKTSRKNRVVVEDGARIGVGWK